jgi:hypothetical protein
MSRHELTPAEFLAAHKTAKPVGGEREERYTECPACGYEGDPKPDGHRNGNGKLGQCPRCNGTLIQTIRWLPEVT